jgi:thiol-disulfide isomerase/thioredoxin
MGRLPFVSFALLCAASCNTGAPDPSGGGRSEAVVSSASAATTPTPSAAPSDKAHALAPPPHPLYCDTAARSLPKSSVAFVDATGTPSDRASVSWSPHRAQWISFFASWCGPCKEEIPRVRDFAKRLERDGVPTDVTFVSIDDDLRELTAFFAAQPSAGLKTSYWLKDGTMRTSFLQPLKMSATGPLPEHAFFDGKSKLRCFVAGTVEESDYAQILATLK